MSNNQSTPKTLEEAIENAICFGPANEVKERLYIHVRDFLSQRFGVPYLKHHSDPEMMSALSDLFTAIVRRQK